MKIKGKILTLGISSILITGLISLAISLTQLSQALTEESKEGLKTTALASLNIYSVQGYGDYTIKDDGNVWRGMNFNVSESTEIVDDIKKEADIDITFFYGDKAVMTSLKDAENKRMTDFKAESDVSKAVLNNGKQYFDSDLILNKKNYQGYYVPITQESGEAIGILLASRSKDKMQATVVNSAIITFTVILAVIFLFIIVMVLFTDTITKALIHSKNTLQEVAGGNLTVQIQDSALKRKDEIGDVARATDSLKNELLHIIGDIKISSDILIHSSDRLDGSSEYTKGIVKDVGKAIDSISESAILQAEETKKASDDIIKMSEIIEKTSQNVNQLHLNSNEMSELNDMVSNTLQELLGVNTKAEEAIEEIYLQTNTTNASALKIQSAINIITSIAEETSLLALNASIEAARAGEQGKGFTVVAYEIKKLAEQSNVSATQIEEIIDSLLVDSTQAVETMNAVKEIIKHQSEQVEKTEEIFTKVNEKMEVSHKHATVIEKNTAELNIARNSMMSIVNQLSEIAENNSASAQQTSAITQEVTKTVTEAAESTGKLKEVVVGLQKNVNLFRL